MMTSTTRTRRLRLQALVMRLRGASAAPAPAQEVKLKLGTVDRPVPSTVMSSEVDTFGILETPYVPAVGTGLVTFFYR